MLLSEDPGTTECPFAGDFSWNEAQVTRILEKFQDLFGDISQLNRKGRLGL